MTDEGYTSFTLNLTDEERGDWQMLAELSAETVEQTIRRVMKHAIDERLPTSSRAGSTSDEPA
jgi:hypothetical protein